jgi:hypothetical protein
MSCASYAAGNLSAFLLNDLSRLAARISLMSWPNDPDSVIINGVIMNSGTRLAIPCHIRQTWLRRRQTSRATQASPASA